MKEIFLNDKALVIFAVFGIVVFYMGLTRPPDGSIINAALAGLFGIAVGQSFQGGRS